MHKASGSPREYRCAGFMHKASGSPREYRCAGFSFIPRPDHGGKHTSAESHLDLGRHSSDIDRVDRNLLFQPRGLVLRQCASDDGAKKRPEPPVPASGARSSEPPVPASRRQGGAGSHASASCLGRRSDDTSAGTSRSDLATARGRRESNLGLLPRSTKTMKLRPGPPVPAWRRLRRTASRTSASCLGRRRR